MNQSESISLWCTVSRNFSLQNEDFHVTWSRVENGIYSVLDWHLNYSQDTTTNDPQFSRKKELRNHSGFPITLKHLRASDSGEYLCNVSSTEYTLLTVHRLHVGKLEIGQADVFGVLLQRFVKTFQNVIDGNTFTHGGRQHAIF